MAQKLAVKVSYTLNFRDIAPLLEFFTIFTNDDILRFFSQKEMVEGKTKRQSAAAIIAEAKTKETEGTKVISENPKEKEAQQTYILTYYNPETEAVEKLATTSNIRIRDDVQQKVEESVGMHSLYPLYSLIAAPLMITVVDKNVLEKILNEREYGTPPDSRDSRIRMANENIKAEIIAVKPPEKAKEALVETIERKEKAENRLEAEIVVLEDTVKTLRKEGSVEKTLESLPPLTRARFIAALRKKKLSKAVIIILLEKDIKFLKEVKKKLMALSLEDLIKLVDTMRALKSK